MFRETSKNKMLRKSSLKIYHISVNRSKIEFIALLHMRSKNFILRRFVYKAGISINAINIQYLVLRLYMQGLDSSDSKIIALCIKHIPIFLFTKNLHKYFCYMPEFGESSSAR